MRSLRYGILYQGIDGFEPTLANERAHLGFGVKPVAQSQRAEGSGKAGGKALVDAFLHQIPGGRDADLARVAAFGRN